jgi:peptidoglycan/LPS O-acetylase OafA/YrhL
LKQQDHYPGLDGLRGFAAVSVVLYHLGHWLYVPALAANSFYAVDVFFCLSGYVLPLAYGHRRNPNLPALKFIRIRLIRLMPLIVVATLISGLYAFFKLQVMHEHGMDASLALALVLGTLTLPYLHASDLIGGPQVFPLNGPQFTLFLELFVNFVWFYIRRFSPLYGSLAIAAICVVLVAMYGYGGDMSTTFFLGFPRVGASFFLGVAAFEIDQRIGHNKNIQRIFWPLFAAMVVLFFFPAPAGLAWGLAWIVVIAPLLVLSGSKIAFSGPMRRLCLLGGEISYPIYVLQYPVFCWVNGVFQMITHKRVPLLEIPLALAAILLFAALALRDYDKPVRKRLSLAFTGKRIA